MAIKCQPNNAFAHYNRGISYDRMNNYNKALENFNRAISLNNTRADF
jgi:tetratricopeptide (TPR) repeat protein